MKTVILTGALLLAAVPAFAGTEGDAAHKANTSGEACLFNRNVDGWGARDEHSLVINDSFGKKYLVKVAGACFDLPWAWSISVRTLGHMDSCVQRGDYVIPRGPSVMRGERCIITSIQPYTKDMEKADEEARAAKHRHADEDTDKKSN